MNSQFQQQQQPVGGTGNQQITEPPVSTSSSTAAASRTSATVPPMMSQQQQTSAAAAASNVIASTSSSSINAATTSNSSIFASNDLLAAHLHRAQQQQQQLMSSAASSASSSTTTATAMVQPMMRQPHQKQQPQSSMSAQQQHHQNQSHPPQTATVHPQQSQSQQHLHQQQPKMRKEIYRYTCDETLFAATWSNKVYEDKRFRLLAGTLLDEENITSNKVFIVELDENVGELVRRATYPHGYPISATKFIPSQDPCEPELFATTSNHLRIFRYHPAPKDAITLECELNSTKSNMYSAPLTNLDWNEVDPTLVATCSIDTTCTVWNIETSQQVGQATTTTRGSQKTQLIAHEKPVHDIAFARLDNGGRDQFATAGADGSVRLFDLRSLQHSTILYEDMDKRALNHIAWNKRDHTKLATVAHESFEVVILDVRVPCRPMARFGNHRGFVNGIAWAPHSTVHICTAGSDRQALIWQMNHFNRDEPILAYTAEGEINQIHWSNNFHQWICICFNNSLEILRV